MSISEIKALYTKRQEHPSFVIVQQLLLTIATLSILVLLVILKTLSISRFNENPIFFVYAIALFIFQLSRLLAAIMYRSRALASDTNEALGQDVYEPTVSFVIPCKNEENVIFENIEHCFNVKYPKHKIEVIIVNDGSTDNTITEIKRAQAVYAQLQVIDWSVNMGKRHAMAAAIKIATGEIIIQLDSDSYIEAKGFKKLLYPFRSSEISAVCAHADPTNKTKNLLTKAQAGYYFMAFRILKAAESTFSFVLCCSGCCSAYRKSTIAPLMDEFANETFMGVNVNFGDDRSLTNLILKTGQRTVYVSNVQAYTIVPETFKQLIRQQIRWKKSWFINTAKASRYMWKIDPFIAATYFYPLTIITLITPIMAVYGLIIFPIINQSFPVWFITGTFLTTGLFMVITSLLSKDNRQWYYLLVWSLINTFILAFLMPYSLLTIRNNKWGTR